MTETSTPKLGGLLLAISLIAGCSPDPVELERERFYELYCGIEPQRRWTHEVWAYRQANDKRNLDLEVAVNLRREQAAAEFDTLEACKDDR